MARVEIIFKIVGKKVETRPGKDKGYLLETLTHLFSNIYDLGNGKGGVFSFRRSEAEQVGKHV